MASEARPGQGAIPDLVARPMEESDFGPCLRLLRGHLAYPKGTLELLPQAWRRLLRVQALNAVVVELNEAPGSSRVVGLGGSVFVDNAWMTQSRRGREPYLTARTISRELGPMSPILRAEAIGHANGAGLNVLILHYAEAPGLPFDIQKALRYRIFESFILTHRGYRIREVLQEFWDEIPPEYILSGWGHLRSDYADYYERLGQSPPSPGSRPYLIGISLEETLANPGAMAAPLFVYSPPLMGFTPAEKRLLQGALAGHTDVELAKTLGVALPTVKSRWRSIYGRVRHHAPEVLHDAPYPAVARGEEKRRHLLNYLHRHPEELRPGAW